MTEFTYDAYTHAEDGRVCIWVDDYWFVPLDAGGEGFSCTRVHRGKNTGLDETVTYYKETPMNLADSVIIPREDFAELEAVAYNQDPTPLGERVASTVQTTLVLAGMAAAVTAGSWGWAKAMDWLETKRHNRTIVEIDRRFKDHQ